MDIVSDEQSESSDTSAQAIVDGNNQYLTFFMAEEEYGVDILCVQEIRGWESARIIPNTADYIKGVLDLRGVIVPIIDLRKCFGLEDVEHGPMTVVIVLKVHSGDSQDDSRTIGILVDAVSDVYTVDEKDMKPAPDLGAKSDTRYIFGMVNIDSKMVILLDTNQLLNLNDMPDFSQLAELAAVAEQEEES